MPFKDLMNDKVTLVKADGTIIRGDIPSLVTGDQIVTFSADLPIEVGDHFLRQLPSGLVEDFIVDDPGYMSGVVGIKPHFQIKIHRSSERPAPPQTIIAHFAGDHSRMYVASTDNSINVVSQVSQEQLANFLSLPQEPISALPYLRLGRFVRALPRALSR